MRRSVPNIEQEFVYKPLVIHFRTVIVSPRRDQNRLEGFFQNIGAPPGTILIYWFWVGTLESVLSERFPRVKNLCTVKCERFRGPWGGALSSVRGKIDGTAIASILFLSG